MSAGGLILEGVRNISLTSYAGSLLNRGFQPAEILGALRETNRALCIPPLPDVELRNIAKSATKWQAHVTERGGERTQRAVYIPRGCFDPRPAVCGFDPAVIVRADTSLGLWQNHKALYAFLAGLFGPWGCHPALRTVGETLGMPHQHVARHVARLERAELILTAPGEYRRTERKFAARSYHFRRHWLFAEHFTRLDPPVFNDIDGSCHHCDGGKLSAGQKQFPAQRNQGVTEILSRFNGDVVPISQRGGAAPLPKRRRAEVPPFDFETTGFFRASLGPDTGKIIQYASILQYSECVSGCGGCRIVYSDGTVKRFECSCGNVEAAA
jgi:hypothetical protein